MKPLLHPGEVKARPKAFRSTRVLGKTAEGTKGLSPEIGCPAEVAMMTSGVPGFNYPLHNNNLYLKAKEAKDDLHVFL